MRNGFPLIMSCLDPLVSTKRGMLVSTGAMLLNETLGPGFCGSSALLLIVEIRDSYEQSLINGGLQIWSFLVAIGFSVSLVDSLGRKTLFLIAGMGMLVTISIWAACSAYYERAQSKEDGSTVITMIFLFYGVASFAWPGLTVTCVAGILPFTIRAKGMSIGFALAALFSVFNQYVNTIGLEALQWRYYFFYVAILVIEVLCVCLLFVEIKGPTLEEIAELFDGKNAKVAKAGQSLR
ncbi:hypothetical protein GGTG_07448 [Gaeumannomyces tritici R3-111a-1]|uniref:Major facilitator superfamily (MFS) profile domain-containing protein n=1 Tax=Gaeumannomyces tritici (strain R3-111a-1) TaxID=644352 RepID=J3P1Q0_GAET3|nr:hypothetical protein GGTG_07448 [Gaeumannomyces tritici R3-111a-1]EJT73592.1 hypothetical protein GGTG_07448 [Gaeumannomyces tritici R3-111a-1]